ncbi:MAG: hypothetical protein UY97_C0009G0004 [Parcubacteria group bacterium GW2011_GWB1_57_6]|nr:MAG: hypothetical protein UY93_C0002G0413 [Parcubacteria group bacterium GW2011_GWA1_56_13]KKW46147.1 MAG: hypothetical protein UY97_C0009G0004 [Parcubacteria group bacterium GW2011_GWB1_57_6]
MKKLMYTIVPFALLALPLAAVAATLSLSADPTHPGVGKLVEITVSIRSDTPVNAFSGTLRFPSDLLAPVAVDDGNSIISMWITHPTLDNGTVAFAGATPGGFSGDSKKLFSVIFNTAAIGDTRLVLADIRVLQNDGEGTNEQATAPPLLLTVAANATSTYTEPVDTFPPEPFIASLGSDQETFGGLSYVVFSAVDKGSGIDHYEVAETRLPWPSSWERAESPFLIRDQYLTSGVSVKAVDRAGNARISVVHRTNLLRPREWPVWGILVVLAGFWYIGRARRRTF